MLLVLYRNLVQNLSRVFEHQSWRWQKADISTLLEDLAFFIELYECHDTAFLMQAHHDKFLLNDAEEAVADVVLERPLNYITGVGQVADYSMPMLVFINLHAGHVPICLECNLGRVSQRLGWADHAPELEEESWCQRLELLPKSKHRWVDFATGFGPQKIS